MTERDTKPGKVQPQDQPPPYEPRTISEILRAWEADGMTKNSLYWRLRQLEAEGK